MPKVWLCTDPYCKFCPMELDLEKVNSRQIVRYEMAYEPGKGLELFEQRLAALEDFKAIDPAIIQKILEVIIPLIQSCLNPPTPASLKTWVPGRRANVAAALRKATAYTWSKNFKLADEILGMPATATDEEITWFVNDCRN